MIRRFILWVKWKIAVRRFEKAREKLSTYDLLDSPEFEALMELHEARLEEHLEKIDEFEKQFMKAAN